MQPADRPEFLRILNGLATTKPGANKLTADALELWWNAMADWSIGDFRAAATQLTTSVEFMPNPFHFEQLRKAASSEAAGDAWAVVVQVNRFSRIGREHLLTPRIERVVAAMGGWSALAMMRTEELPFREKRFRELWLEFGEVDAARAALPNLARVPSLVGPRSTAQLLPSRKATP